MPIVPQPRLTVIDHGPKDFLTYPEYIATSKQQVREGEQISNVCASRAK